MGIYITSKERVELRKLEDWTLCTKRDVKVSSMRLYWNHITSV